MRIRALSSQPQRAWLTPLLDLRSERLLGFTEYERIVRFVSNEASPPPASESSKEAGRGEGPRGVSRGPPAQGGNRGGAFRGARDVCAAGRHFARRRLPDPPPPAVAPTPSEPRNR